MFFFKSPVALISKIPAILELAGKRACVRPKKFLDLQVAQKYSQSNTNNKAKPPQPKTQKQKHIFCPHAMTDQIDTDGR